ncbi:hypothetical protein ACHAXS_004408 [Conticribra weissflogii]
MKTMTPTKGSFKELGDQFEQRLHQQSNKSMPHPGGQSQLEGTETRPIVPQQLARNSEDTNWSDRAEIRALASNYSSGNHDGDSFTGNISTRSANMNSFRGSRSDTGDNYQPSNLTNHSRGVISMASFTDPTPRQSNRKFFTSPTLKSVEKKSFPRQNSLNEHDDGSENAIEGKSIPNPTLQMSPESLESQDSVETEPNCKPQHETLVQKSTSDEEPATSAANSGNECYQEQKKELQQTQHQHYHHERKQEQRRMRKKCTTAMAVIAEDAYVAFSPYRPVLDPITTPINPLKRTDRNPKQNPGANTKGKKRSSNSKISGPERDTSGQGRGARIVKKSSRKRRQPLESTQENVGHIRHVSDSSFEYIGSVNVADTSLEERSARECKSDMTILMSDDLKDFITSTDDPLLQHYVPQMATLNDQYYEKIKPFRIGNRNLPLNQLEVVLRRRAIKKREVGKFLNGVDSTSPSSTGINVGSSTTFATPNLISSNSTYYRRPPSRGSQQSSSTARRTLFPSSQISPLPLNGMYTSEEDDSTISSTTAASTWTAPSLARPPLAQSRSQPNHQMQSNSVVTATATTIHPREEVVGDTSLGLKLTILQGKVIVQKITPLDDGRASPAQLCGLVAPGDIIIAVNGKTLINGSIQNPVPMDQMFKVLQPLSQPLEEGGKFYAREVRLRFLLGEGKGLLREQGEREKKRQKEMEIRKQMGLDRVGMDPAGDLFSISSFMAVDQHSGMPLFGHSWEDSHKEDEAKGVSGDSLGVVDMQDDATRSDKARGIMVQSGEMMQKLMPWFSKVPPAVQAQIAHQLAVETQYIRDRRTSRFFMLDKYAPALLRPASPLLQEKSDSIAYDPSEARKLRLERGSEAMLHAKSLLDTVELKDRGLDNIYPDEDPMEVASRVCGTASIRTGASRRRWHRGDSVMSQSSAASSTTGNNNQMDTSTIRSGESVEACDHRLLVGLAAHNEAWKKQVVKRLEMYVSEKEQESKDGLRGVNNFLAEEEEESIHTSLDSLLFGDVSSIMGKKKQSMALPPGEMTSMLYDLVEQLDSDLPDQIFMKDDSSAYPLRSPEKGSMPLSAPTQKNSEVKKAKDFLINDALSAWLKSFRPLPWSQRRVLWPIHQPGMNSETSMVSSRVDDGMSLSMASGSTAPKCSDHKRNLREVIEDMELDHETRRETCKLVTFYFTQRSSLWYINSINIEDIPSISQEDEMEAAKFIDMYGSYVDIYECLVFAGKIRSKLLVDKIVSVAKFDGRHAEALKALRKAKVLLFYEPHMLSAIIELLPSISAQSISSKFDFMSLLVSSYPDLQPWCVKEYSKHKPRFYFKYLSSLMHHEDGNDSAKRDKTLVKEWCLMLSSPGKLDLNHVNYSVEAFSHIASKSDASSIYYHRDISFLMDISMRMSQFGLALDLANEILSDCNHRGNKQSILDIVHHLRTISDVAIKGSNGVLNTALLSQVIAFFNVISPCMIEHSYEFTITTELTRLLNQCVKAELDHDSANTTDNVGSCILTISENAPPLEYLRVLSSWEHTFIESPAIMSAIHTCMIRGARKGVNQELSGSLLRIQRAREEGRRPHIADAVMEWENSNKRTQEEDTEEGGYLWANILNGSTPISK